MLNQNINQTESNSVTPQPHKNETLRLKSSISYLFTSPNQTTFDFPASLQQLKKHRTVSGNNSNQLWNKHDQRFYLRLRTDRSELFKTRSLFTLDTNNLHFMSKAEFFNEQTVEELEQAIDIAKNMFCIVEKVYRFIKSGESIKKGFNHLTIQAQRTKLVGGVE